MNTPISQMLFNIWRYMRDLVAGALVNRGTYTKEQTEPPADQGGDPLSGLDAALRAAYGRCVAAPSVGDEIDSALAEDDTRYCFTVIASREKVIACFLLSKERPIPVDALRHVDSLRGVLEQSILHNADATGATRQ